MYANKRIYVNTIRNRNGFKSQDTCTYAHPYTKKHHLQTKKKSTQFQFLRHTCSCVHK